jgi:hypothetical protein
MYLVFLEESLKIGDEVEADDIRFKVESMEDIK